MSKAKAQGVKKFINYGLGDGQNVAKQLPYAPLPDAAADQGARRRSTSCSATGAPL